MALRLRRGTDAERLTITPLEGELIYTTDTKKLFIGDGSTAGGSPVDTDSITDELADLTDVDLTGLADGQTIAYNLANTRFEPANLASAVNDLTDVDTTGVSVGDVLKWNGAAFVPGAEGAITPGATYAINIDGDLTGSVFGDDSTLLVDGIDGSIHTDIIRSSSLTLSSGTSLLPIEVNVLSEDDNVTFRLARTSTTDIGASSLQYGRLLFGRDDVSGPVDTCSISGYQDGLAISHDTAGLHLSASENLYIVDGQFAFGTFSPAANAKVDVAGNLHVTGGYTQFGSLTTTERNAITAAAGMVIWNSTTSQFEGFDGTNWINLVDGTTSP